jgi:WD40 repeat protein
LKYTVTVLNAINLCKMSHLTSTTPRKVFEDNQSTASAVAVFPDNRRMITCSHDKTLRLWDLRTGVMLKKMEGHHDRVLALAISRDGQLIASGDESGEVVAWHGETGELLTSQPIKAHSHGISSLDFSPDATELATGSGDCTVKLWNTSTWHQWLQGAKAICWSSSVRCIRYSPSGEFLVIATDSNINIFNPGTGKCTASFEAHPTVNMSIAWTPDGVRLLSGGNSFDPTIREWDTLTWNQVGDPWAGHTGSIKAIAINSAGTLAASASEDNDVRLWRLSDRRMIAIFKHSHSMQYVTFSIDGEHLLSGGEDNKTSKWVVPNLGINSNVCFHP